MEEITNELGVRMFAAYLFCPFRYERSASENLMVGGITYGWNIIDGHKGLHYRTEHCKLILSPLSSITDEHAIEAMKLQRVIPTSTIFLTEHSPLTKIKHALANKMFGIIACDYLRSLGYDCGYGSIPSLIEAGLAIKKEI